MAMMIREYLGYEGGIKVDWNYAPVNNLTESTATNAIDPNSIMVDIEGIHVGPTRNFTWYMDEALIGSVPTWTKPYQRPLIMHHNEKDGKIIGRIKFVTYQDKKTLSGTGALLFTANVPDKEGKEGVNNGTLNTVSIGVIVHDARCSICGHNLAEDGPCDHERGQVYDGKTCYWMIYKMEAKELSYVIVPSDIYAQNIKIYKPSEINLKENSKGVFDLSEANQVIIDENGNKPAEQTPPATPPVTPPVVDTVKLQSDLDAANATILELQGQIKTLEADKEAEAKAKADAIKDLDDTKVLLAQANKSLDEVKQTLTAKESELSNAISLREAAETQILEANKTLKAGLVENCMILRQALGKPLMAAEDLEKRSDDSLKDAIKDLKEELSAPGDVTKITPAANPGLVEDNNNSTLDVKEKKNNSNIDLAEGLENLLGSFMNLRK